MAIKLRNKRSAEFSTSSMSDLVFLLLIFFMLTSTLVSPSAIKLLLPQSNGKTLAKPAKVTVSIDGDFQYFIDDVPILITDIYPILNQKLAGETEASVFLEVNFDVPIQYIVDVIDAVNNINDLDIMNPAKNKVILKTEQK